jgi:hypothetical protein
LSRALLFGLCAIAAIAMVLPAPAARAATPVAPAVSSSAVAASAGPPTAAPAPPDSPTLFRQGVKAIQRGATDEAIDDFELLADRGFVHPDASFDRAVAYVDRARSHHAHPGDLGRAAAALEETLLLRPGDGQAAHALVRVREEIARRRSHEGDSPVAATPSIGRAVAGLLPEDVWAFGAALGSLLLTAGLIARRLSRRPHVILGGAISVGVGTLLLALCGGLAAAARHFRVSSRPAVVVVDQARLLDAQGRPIQQKNGVPEHVAVPEGAKVHIVGHQGQLAHVEWGATHGWVPDNQLRLLVRP